MIKALWVILRPETVNFLPIYKVLGCGKKITAVSILKNILKGQFSHNLKSFPHLEKLVLNDLVRN